MKILAQNEKEFYELVRTFRYLHDFTVWYKTFNWKFWQWISSRSIFTYHGECLDLYKYPLLNSLAHLYRIEHAHLEDESGIEESIELKKLLQIDKTIQNTLEWYEKWKLESKDER